MNNNPYSLKTPAPQLAYAMYPLAVTYELY